MTPGLKSFTGKIRLQCQGKLAVLKHEQVRLGSLPYATALSLPFFFFCQYNTHTYQGKKIGLTFLTQENIKKQGHETCQQQQQKKKNDPSASNLALRGGTENVNTGDNFY